MGRKHISVVVTGRAEEEDVNLVLDTYHGMFGIKRVVELGDPWAGLYARLWAENHDVEVTTVREATPVKTAVAALKRRISAVVAFPLSNPTLVDRATRVGVQVCGVEIRETGSGRGKAD